MKFLVILLLLCATQTFAATSKIHFVKPHNNQEVTPTFDVEFKVDGMSVEKAGVMKKGTGHHHLIIDGLQIPAGKVIPKDATHLHFGDASTHTTLTLTPGAHTLTLQFADGAHVSLGPDYSTTISVTVK